MAMLEINWQPSRRELRQFAGIWFPLACAVVCWFVYRATHSWQLLAALGVIAAVLSVVAFAVPAVALRLYVGWMVAAFPIGWTVSHLLMGVIYYLLITPMGLLMRCFGRDAMGRKFNRTRDTYWVAHTTPRDKQQYFRQY